MALTVNTVEQQGSVTNFASFFVTTDATAAVTTYFQCGFVPRYVKFVNLTDRIQDEFVKGMTDGYSLHTVAAGTVTYVTTGGITLETGATTAGALSVVTPDGSLVLDGSVPVVGFSVPAALMVASKSFAVLAIA